jgi:hypothetical protein
MSSKRGRKRNDNLPPNRAREVQRTFRARRAAHLDVSPSSRLSLPSLSHPSAISYSFLSLSQALEQRIAELEEENSNLRAALNLPPSQRPPLGKGPTGKEKAKPPSARPPRVSTDLEAVSRAGSSADPPTSTRAQSLPPSTVTATMRPSPNAVRRDPSMMMDEEQNQQATHSSSPSTGHRSSGVPAHTKAPSRSTYPSPAQSSSHANLPGTMYPPVASRGPQHYDHPSDHPVTELYTGRNDPVRDLREEQQRFPHSQPYHSGPEAARLPQHSPSTHYPTQQLSDLPSAQRPIPFSRKRTISDPREFSLVPSMERLAC